MRVSVFGSASARICVPLVTHTPCVCVGLRFCAALSELVPQLRTRVTHSARVALSSATHSTLCTARFLNSLRGRWTPPPWQSRSTRYARARSLTHALSRATAQLSHGIDVMIGITNDMLDVEALRLGRLKITAALTNVRDVLAGCAKTSSRGVAIDLRVADEVPAMIDVDALRMRQVCVRRSASVCMSVCEYACVHLRACVCACACEYCVVCGLFCERHCSYLYALLVHRRSLFCVALA